MLSAQRRADTGFTMADLYPYGALPMLAHCQAGGNA
jgi:hypothetical protein